MSLRVLLAVLACVAVVAALGSHECIDLKDTVAGLGIANADEMYYLPRKSEGNGYLNDERVRFYNRPPTTGQLSLTDLTGIDYAVSSGVIAVRDELTPRSGSLILALSDNKDASDLVSPKPRTSAYSLPFLLPDSVTEHSMQADRPAGGATLVFSPYSPVLRDPLNAWHIAFVMGPDDVDDGLQSPPVHGSPMDPEDFGSYAITTADVHKDDDGNWEVLPIGTRADCLMYYHFDSHYVLADDRSSVQAARWFAVRGSIVTSSFVIEELIGDFSLRATAPPSSRPSSCSDVTLLWPNSGQDVVTFAERITGFAVMCDPATDAGKDVQLLVATLDGTTARVYRVAYSYTDGFATPELIVSPFTVNPPISNGCFAFDASNQRWILLAQDGGAFSGPGVGVASELASGSPDAATYPLASSSPTSGLATAEQPWSSVVVLYDRPDPSGWYTVLGVVIIMIAAAVIVVYRKRMRKVYEARAAGEMEREEAARAQLKADGTGTYVYRTNMPNAKTAAEIAAEDEANSIDA